MKFGAFSEESISSHDRILLSAKHLFSKDGYENTSTASIARMAGTSESQLMKHFGSKEGLLEAIFDHGWTNMGAMFRGIHDLKSPTEKLEVLLELIITAMDRDPELRDLMLLEGRRFRKEGHMVLLTKGYLQFIGILDAILKEMRSTGELRSDVPIDAVRSALNSMFEGMMRDMVLSQRVGFPAHYTGNDLRHIFKIVLSAFVKKK